MNLLAIDTAANLCAACILDVGNDRILASISEDIGRGHAERLMDVITDVLIEAKVDYSDISKIAVSTGPGSFTGIRVGLATARGISVGLGIPITGINTLEAIAGSVDLQQKRPVLSAIDAKRDEIYHQVFGVLPTGKFDRDPGVSSPASVAAMASDLLDEYPSLVMAGSGAPLLNAQLAGEIPVQNTLSSGPIEVIARLAARRESDEKRPEPVYLRAPDAKPQSDYALPRID